MSDTVRISSVQAASSFFDKADGVARAEHWIAEASRDNPDVIAFGEAWLPGYPWFVDSPLSDLWWEAAADLLANGIEIPGPETDRLCKAAKLAGTDLVIGVNEIEPRTRATLYCTLLFISKDGEILSRHRKMKPTHHERSVWGDGDVKGLKPLQRPYGHLSGLNCWEHNAVLPGFTLMSQGVDVHVAAWPGREPETAPTEPVWARQLLLSRAFASQSGAWVICSAGLRRKADVPERYHPLVSFEHNGGAAIIDPRGEIVAGPLIDQEGVLTVEADLELARKCKVAIDPAGHYSRPDLFRLIVDGEEVYPGAERGPLATKN